MRIVFLGGGTLGHTVPNLSVIADFKQRSSKHQILYIADKKGIERSFVRNFATKNNIDMEIKEIFCGKLRRYFSFLNFLDFFRVFAGIFQSIFVLIKFKPHAIFSKGGYVSVSGVVACGFLNFFRKISGKEKIILLVHESDVIPGLANKIGAKFATKILVSFEETKKYFKKQKTVLIGNPIRKEILKGDKKNGIKICGFNTFKPIILVMGGSLGAMQINNLLWENLNELLKKYQIVHITGKGNLKFGLKKNGYKQFEMLFEELKDVYAMCDLAVTRGGANSLTELASLKKKAVVLPLGTHASRGDQIVNAKVCAKKYGWQVLYDNPTFEQFKLAIEVSFAGDFYEDKSNIHIKASNSIVNMIYDLVIS